MNKKSNTRPHPPATPACKAGRLANAHRPAPLCNKGRAAGGVPSSKGDCEQKEKPGEWIPKEYRLPDSIKEIEAGRPGKQLELFGRDESKERRLARLLANVPVAMAASRLESRPTDLSSHDPQRKLLKNKRLNNDSTSNGTF
ncbi:MAG: hypothetical protein ABFC77_11170 [Thermoguttaceae bacterium]